MFNDQRTEPQKIHSFHLLEPDSKPATVEVWGLRHEPNGLDSYQVKIDGQGSYFVHFNRLFVGQGYLSSYENIAYCTVRARRFLQKKLEKNQSQKISIDSTNWDKFKPRYVDSDISFDDAQTAIGRLLYRVEKQPYNTAEKSFNLWDLKASLGFENFDRVLKHLQDQGHIAFYKYPMGQEVTDRWVVSRAGFEYFEKQIKEESETKGNVSRTSPSITSKVVETAIADAETLLKNNGATSGVDRIHTALHGHIIAVCDGAGIQYGKDPSLTELFKLLRSEHPVLQSLGPRSQDISKVLNSLANILDALNPLCNQASVAHPNPDLLAEEEALLVINTAKTLLHYLDAKFSN